MALVALFMSVPPAKADYLCMSDDGYPQHITCYGEDQDGKSFTKSCVKPHDAVDVDCLDSDQQKTEGWTIRPRDEAERRRR